MNIYEAVDYINSINIGELPYRDITSITYGYKIINGVETEEPCITFGFLEKKPLSAIPDNELLPKTLDINGKQVKTDVVQRDIVNKVIAYCHTPSATVDPVRQNYLKRRPLQGGASSVYVGGSDATLGLLVRDKSDGQVVALSNNHVYAASNLLGVYQHVNETGSNSILPVSARQPGSPTANPYGSSNPADDFIGTSKRAVPIGDINYNKISGGSAAGSIIGTSCDAAVVSLDSYSLINSSSVDVIGFDIPGPYQFATDYEITSLGDPASPNYRSPVFRSGRTLGPIGFPGNSYSCRLSVIPTSFGITLVTGYSDQTSYFYNSFYIQGNVYSVQGGDSGSATFALLSSQSTTLSAWKCIGLVFAGPSNSLSGICTRISTVAEKLNIAPWNGSTPTITPETQTLYLSAQDYLPWNTSSCVTLSGRKFYQAGGLTIPTPSLFTVNAAPLYWYSVANNGSSTWLAVASGVNTVAKSTDNGVTWSTATNLPIYMSGGIAGYGSDKYIAYGNGAWIVYDRRGSYWSEVYARSTDDGVTWSLLPVAAGAARNLFIEEIYYHNNRFVTLAKSQSAITISTDSGLTFGGAIYLPKLPNSTSYYRGIAANGSTWIAISDYYSNPSYNVGAISTDSGLTWAALTNLPYGGGGCFDIAYGNGLWVCTPYLWTNLQYVSCIISDNNGASWSLISYNDYRPRLPQIRYNNGKFYQLEFILGSSFYMPILDSTTRKWTVVGLPTTEYWTTPSVNNTGTVICLDSYGTQGFKYQ